MEQDPRRQTRVVGPPSFGLADVDAVWEARPPPEPGAFGGEQLDGDTESFVPFTYYLFAFHTDEFYR